MALRTVSNTGGNWNATTAWVGGVVPIANDTVDFTATSGNIVVNVSTANLTGINFTNYVGVITFNANINVQGALNLGTNGFRQAGASGLNINGSSTISGTTIFNNISITTGTQTLTSDLNCQNLTSGSGGTNTINGLFNVNVSGNITATGVILGTSTIVLIGTGLWTAPNGSNTFRIPIIINTNGIITLANTLDCGGNLTYIKGIVKSNNTTISFVTSILINLHKIIFKNVIISVGATITMNEFFNGSRSIATNISSNSVSNYTISFQDGFEKIAKFVNIINCTLSKPLQLLVLTKSKSNIRKSTNIGIRYINQSPNGIAKGDPSVNLKTFGAGGLLPDPTNL